MKITPGKLAGMKAVSNERGVIAAAAMDQRGSLKKALAKEKGGDIGDKDMEEFKIHVTEVLTRHASAILLDPEWGLPGEQAARRTTPGCCWPTRRPATTRTRPDGCPTCSTSGRCAGSRKRAPTASRSCSTTRRSIRSTSTTTSTPGSSGSATSAAPTTSRSSSSSSATRRALDEKGLEYAKKKPEIVTGDDAEFTKDRYGVDVMKVEVPINMKFVEGREGVRRPEGLLEAGSDGPLPPLGRRRHQAVHLPVGRRQQRRVHRIAGAGRPKRARASPACCADAPPGRKASRSSASRAAQAFRKWLEDEGVEEHQQRQRRG